MRKGQKPSKHYRNVRTKIGRKRVLVNRRIKKKTLGRIKPTERKIFKYISNPSIFQKEYGGGLDFDKKGVLENVNMVPGKEFEVDLPPDYEVQYHTHPDKQSSPPTPEDVIALLYNKKQQAEMIVRDGKMFVIIKTPATKKLSNQSVNKIYKQLNDSFTDLAGPNWENKWQKHLESLGFVVYRNNNPNTEINLPIKPIEPKHMKRRKRWVS